MFPSSFLFPSVLLMIMMPYGLEYPSYLLGSAVLAVSLPYSLFPPPASSLVGWDKEQKRPWLLWALMISNENIPVLPTLFWTQIKTHAAILARTSITTMFISVSFPFFLPSLLHINFVSQLIWTRSFFIWYLPVDEVHGTKSWLWQKNYF